MKTLVLMRHAKSSWAQEDMPDFDRPLNERGLEDAPRMAARIQSHGLSFDLVVTSSAVRARSTAEIVADQLSLPRQCVQLDRSLYLATRSQLFTALWAVDDAVTSLLLVGHNPGITEFANALCPLRSDNIPTAGVVWITFSAHSWAEVREQSGELALFDYPKQG